MSSAGSLSFSPPLFLARQMYFPSSCLSTLLMSKSPLPWTLIRPSFSTRELDPTFLQNTWTSIRKINIYEPILWNKLCKSCVYDYLSLVQVLSMTVYWLGDKLIVMCLYYEMWSVNHMAMVTYPWFRFSASVYWWMNKWKVMCLYYIVNYVPVTTYPWFRFSV